MSNIYIANEVKILHLDVRYGTAFITVLGSKFAYYIFKCIFTLKNHKVILWSNEFIP